MANVKKKCKVIILPTQQQSSIFLKGSGLLEYNVHPPLHGVKELGWTYQHLYITSDEQIKELP